MKILVRVDLYSQSYFVIALGYHFWSGNSWDLVFAGNNCSAFNVKNSRIFCWSFCHFIVTCAHLSMGWQCAMRNLVTTSALSFLYGKGVWKGMFGAVTIHSFPGCSKVLSPAHQAPEVHLPDTRPELSLSSRQPGVISNYLLEQQRSVSKWSQAVSEAQTRDW